MFGNLINNRQFKNLIRSKVVEIEPFIEEDLSTVHYTLHVDKIRKKKDNGSWYTIWDFSKNLNPYLLKANEYVKVVIVEKIRLNDENIIGHFIPASNLIEEGLLLVAGKIDKKYGNTGLETGPLSEMINFGLKNLTNNDVFIKPNHRVAHLELYDLRGIISDKIVLTEEERLLRMKRMRIAEDDGVFYGNGNL